MTRLFPDTHPEMEALPIQPWRQASPTRKMTMLAQLNASARMLALMGLRPAKPSCAADWRGCCWEKSWRAKCDRWVACLHALRLGTYH
ncbi:MAG: hypothetical protein RMN24_05515 [Anaerolineae bacterium]|nr:hypothetical protein [Caldilineales bacterium]MDW8268608.1 hypothetical protein [Anaerolineae bacterium]